MDASATAQLAAFAAGLRFEHLPEPVVRKTEGLLVDWFGSAVAGHGARPVDSITRFAQAMGHWQDPARSSPGAHSSALTWLAWPMPMSTSTDVARPTAGLGTR